MSSSRSLLQTLRYGLKDTAKVSAWDATADALGTAAWLGVYNCHLEQRMGVTGYIVAASLEGLISNLVAAPFVRQECIAAGETADEATRSACNYFKMYMVLDGLFQPSEDLVISFGKGEYFSGFEMVADPTFEKNELSWALAMYLLTFALLHISLSKLVLGHVELAETLKFGGKSYAFYTMDKPFNVEWESLNSLEDIFYCCLAMWGVSFTAGMLKGVGSLCVDHYRARSSVTIEDMDDSSTSYVQLPDAPLRVEAGRSQSPAAFFDRSKKNSDSNRNAQLVDEESLLSKNPVV